MNRPEKKVLDGYTKFSETESSLYKELTPTSPKDKPTKLDSRDSLKPMDYLNPQPFPHVLIMPPTFKSSISLEKFSTISLRPDLVMLIRSREKSRILKR